MTNNIIWNNILILILINMLIGCNSEANLEQATNNNNTGLNLDENSVQNIENNNINININNNNIENGVDNNVDNNVGLICNEDEVCIQELNICVPDCTKNNFECPEIRPICDEQKKYCVEDNQNGHPSADTHNSPFGFLPASVNFRDYPDNGFTDAINIGVKWHRPEVSAFWFLIQPDLDVEEYDWEMMDEFYKKVPDGINILANITPDFVMQPHGYVQTDSYIPINQEKYSVFVQKTVERYDGDGIDDVEGLTNPVKYWQISNEPHSSISDFAKLQEITYIAIKNACEDCKVLIAGVAGFPFNYIDGFNNVYESILSELNGNYVDIFDFHWYGSAKGDYRFKDPAIGQDVFEHIKTNLLNHGFSADLPIWITEMGSYSGQPNERNFQFQTEREQAMDYFKRNVYSLARGIKKIFQAFGLKEGFKHENGYFDHTGLIYDGQEEYDLGVGVKKLGYYTYKKMTETLEGVDWNSITMLKNGESVDNLYLFEIMKNNNKIHIAWWDYYDESQNSSATETKELIIENINWIKAIIEYVVPNVESGQEVTDYNTAFESKLLQVSENNLKVQLKKDPVFIFQSN